MTSIDVKKEKSIKISKTVKAFYKLGISTLQVLDNMNVKMAEIQECCLSEYS